VEKLALIAGTLCHTRWKDCRSIYVWSKGNGPLGSYPGIFHWQT